MPIQLDLTKFLVTADGRSPQRDFFNLTVRNQCMSGGFGSGKTYVACQKVVTLMSAFPNSRWVIGRRKYTDLMRTTVSTFFKVCPEALYDPWQKGSRTKEKVTFINKSQVEFMHFTDIDESVIRGLELNGAYIDQAEELDENIYLLLGTRIGRWDEAEVPEFMLTDSWPRNEITNRPKVPSYYFLTVNPDSQLHFIYRRFHPDSLEWKEKYSHNHAMVMASTLDNPTVDKEIISEMMTRDQVFIDRFVYGKWGISESAIHRIQAESILEVSSEFVLNLTRKSKLYRVMDHGDTAPTCCLWVAVFNNQYFIYREYYQPDRLVSHHRRVIQELSVTLEGEAEVYSGNYADPDIFIKHSQTQGKRFSIADEYLDTTFITDSKPIAWSAASNDEFGTRNRINETLKLAPTQVHPITGKTSAPRLYFIIRNADNPFGCYESILQTKAARREQVGSENGKPIFSDERDKKITDHAYDPVRYFISRHFNYMQNVRSSAQPGSFFATIREAKKLTLAGKRRARW